MRKPKNTPSWGEIRAFNARNAKLWRQIAKLANMLAKQFTEKR